MEDQRSILKGLRRRWGVFAASCVIYLGSGYALLRHWWSPANSARWLALVSLALVYLLVVLGRNLGSNHRPGESRLLPTFGWGNRATLLRGLLLAGLLGFLFSPRPTGPAAWLPGILYTLAILADFLDGYLARVTNHATELGEILDMNFDGVGMLGASLLAVSYGQAPWWYLLVGLARTLYLGGIWIRERLGAPIYELPPSITRRGLAGLQMGFLAAILWPVFSPPGTHIAAALFGLPFLLGFASDFLIASGVIRAQGGKRSQSRQTLTRWLPFGLRLAVLALLLPPLLEAYRVFSSLDSSLVVLTILSALVVVLLSLGIASRSAAILGLCLLGFQQVLASLTGAQIALIFVYFTILFLGGGALALWSPEETLIQRRAGEPKTLRAEPSA